MIPSIGLLILMLFSVKRSKLLGMFSTQLAMLFFQIAPYFPPSMRLVEISYSSLPSFTFFNYFKLF